VTDGQHTIREHLALNDGQQLGSVAWMVVIGRMPKRHRYVLLTLQGLEPTTPVPGVPLDVQRAHMQELRALQKWISEHHWLRDDRMAALVISNALSRVDMAVATGLVRSRVDQLIREQALWYEERRRREGEARVARHTA
jgi:hypothetical protein